jgi:hypothetical protein
MPELLDNPVIKDEEISDDAFLEAAALADKGEDIPADLISAKPADTRAAEPETPKETEGAPDNSETDPEKQKVERPRDELGRFTKTETGEDIPENERQTPEKPAETKTETPYTKAQKERERQENLLKNFQAEKEAFRAEAEQAREQLRREAAELQQAREQNRAPAAPGVQQTRYSSGELLEAAEQFESRAEKAFDEGNGELFKESLRLAKDARQQAGQMQQLEHQAQAQAMQQRFQAVYADVTERTVKAEPALNDPDSPLAKEVTEFLRVEPVFSHIPDGFAKLVQVAKWKLDAGSASELREQNKKLQAEVERLNGLTQLNGSGPTSPPSQKSFESMSDEEQDAYLLRRAANLDAANT